MNKAFLLALPLCALLAAPTPPPTLTTKDGRVFHLKAPPQVQGGRVVFTTTEGKTYSLNASDVQSEVLRPPTPAPTSKVYNPMDSQSLGAIARQQRAETGKTSELGAGTPTPRPRPATHTPKPAGKGGSEASSRPTRTPTPRKH